MILLLLIAPFLIYFNIIWTKKIFQDLIFSKAKKVFHSVMLWIIPFGWYYVIKSQLTPERSIMTKSNRAKQKSYSSSNTSSFPATDGGDV